jgi:glutamine amidotransferase
LIAVLDYGIGNLRSAQKALEHAGADARLVTTPEEAAGASGVVLPGVGAFGACMDALEKSELDRVALDAVEAGTPFLGICVGMQLLYEGSEENPGRRGLAILDGVVRHLPATVKRPQMQWNVLDIVRVDDPLLDGLDSDAWVYFVHSYAADVGDDTVASCDYGRDVAAIVRRGQEPLWATQFHPEKSSACGLRLLANFVKICEPR